MIKIIAMRRIPNLPKKVLVLDPHGDDGSVSCYASLSKLVDDSCEIFYVVFSISETSVPKGFPKDIVKYECLEALDVLGIVKHDIMNYPVRRLPEYRQEILDYLVKLNKQFKPDVVYLPSRFDTHQDHKTICDEGIRAFRKTSSMYGFDMPWNAMNNHIHMFEILEEKHIQKKIDAITCFKSQIKKDNPVLKEHKVRAHAIDRGSIIAVEYAEAFEVIREIRK